ncbi:MAG: hypothetical protein KJ077_24410 [Anaerolineae bacterium]|nr:hypothetical protein [Anaerolineae bacterium]
MIDKFLTIAAAFDWISPTLAYIQDFRYGQVSDFGIPASSGWSRSNIKRLLKKHGVPVWGVMLNFRGDTLMFTVPYHQAQAVSDLLLGQGVSILHAPAEVTSSPPQPSGSTWP